MGKPRSRFFVKLVVVLVAVYAVLLGGLYAAMLQPPPVFGRIMAKLPAVAFLLFPFEPMWLKRSQAGPFGFRPAAMVKVLQKLAPAASRPALKIAR